MADSTIWTLQAVNHDATAIKFIPESADEANVATSPYYYYHLQDGGFDVSLPTKKRLWAGKSNIDRMGESLISENYENRTIKMQLVIKAKDRNYVITAFKELHQFAEECGRYASYPPFSRGYWYIKKQWLGVLDTAFAYMVIMAADVSPLPDLYSEQGLQFYNSGVYTVPVTITFVTEPAWRNIAPFGSGAAVATNHTVYFDTIDGDNYVEIAAADIVGDLPPLVEMQIKGSTSSTARRVHLAVRSRVDVTNFVQWGECEDGGTLNGAALATDADASGGASNNCLEVTPSPITKAARSNVAISSNELDNVGTFRIRVRAKLKTGIDDVTDVGLNAIYEIGTNEFFDVGDGQPVYLTAVNQWELVDLGKVTIEPARRLVAAIGAITYSIETTHDHVDDHIYLDYIEIVPVDDGHGWVETQGNLSSDTYRVHIDQGYCGEQLVFATILSEHSSYLADYDCSWLHLNQGVKTRIYFNVEASNNSAPDNFPLNISVLLTRRFLTVA